MNIFESDPKLVWLVGTNIASMVGLLITAIKGTFEIKRLKIEIASLKRKASAEESLIYVPKRTEERIQYGAAKLFRMAALAMACAVISISSASIAIPAVQLQLRGAADEKRRLDGEIAEWKKETDRLQQRLKEAEAAYYRDVNGQLIPKVPPSFVPQLSKPSPTPFPQPNIETTMLNALTSELFSRMRYAWAEDMNALLLQRIRSGDYNGFLQLIHPDVRHKFTTEEFGSFKDKIPKKFRAPKSNDLLGAMNDQKAGLYVWRLRSDEAGATTLETLGVNDSHIVFLTFQVYEFPSKREDR